MKNKKRKVFEQIEKSACEEQFENDWKVPIRGKGNKRTREKEANENDLSVQRRKIFEQLEEMEEAQTRREATADEESGDGKNTRKGKYTLQNKRKDFKITKTSAIERIGKEAVIDEMENMSCHGSSRHP